MSKKKKAKEQFLNRPIRILFRFSAQEVKTLNGKVKRSGLSRAEYGRRKMLDIAPAAEMFPSGETAPAREEQPALGSKV